MLHEDKVTTFAIKTFAHERLPILVFAISRWMNCIVRTGEWIANYEQRAINGFTGVSHQLQQFTHTLIFNTIMIKCFDQFILPWVHNYSIIIDSIRTIKTFNNRILKLLNTFKGVLLFVKMHCQFLSSIYYQIYSKHKYYIL